jgi:hypothetical protein
MYIAPQQFGSTAGPIHRMGDGEGYEFIYVGQLWSKFAKDPGVGAWAG